MSEDKPDEILEVEGIQICLWTARQLLAIMTAVISIGANIPESEIEGWDLRKVVDVFRAMTKLNGQHFRNTCGKNMN